MAMTTRSTSRTPVATVARLARLASLAMFAALAALALPAAAAAQTASLSGVVGDSIRGGPLAGALVKVTGSPRQATTDGHGAFRIDSIAPGTHSIVVTHPLLDTLGLQVRSAPFTLAAGTELKVGLQTPSFDEVREGSCPIGGATYGPAMLAGRVVRADTDEPAAGAAVSLVFKSLTVANGPERVRSGHADASGLFAICGLPARLAGNVQASLGGVTTGDVAVSLNGERFATAMLSIGVPGEGRAALAGVVRTKSGSPVGGAQVSITGTSALATTAADGSFTLAGLPSGTRELVVRKIGFARTSEAVTLSARAPASAAIVLDEAQVLREVKVVGKLDGGLSRTGFTDRKQVGMGWYLTPEEIDKMRPLLVTDAVRSAAGLRVAPSATGNFLQASRGPSSTSDGCINIFIDHARFEQVNPGDVDAALPVEDLGAIEFYPSATTTPIEFHVAGETCATLVLWSKTRLSYQKP